jgi:hypothetical protein
VRTARGVGGVSAAPGAALALGVDDGGAGRVPGAGHAAQRATAYVHHPQVQYERQGVACMHDSAVGTSQPRWEVGTALPVVYDPASPDDACIDTVGEKYFVALWLAAAGAITTVVGIALAR